MTRVLLILSAFMIVGAGCFHNTVVRDTKVVQTELNFFEQAASQQADMMESLIRSHPDCACVDGALPEGECLKAAKLLLTARVRVPYHKAMALYNSGITEERPPESPPAVPDPDTFFCGEPVALLIGF